MPAQGDETNSDEVHSMPAQEDETNPDEDIASTFMIISFFLLSLLFILRRTRPLSWGFLCLFISVRRFTLA